MEPPTQVKLGMRLGPTEDAFIPPASLHQVDQNVAHYKDSHDSQIADTPKKVSHFHHQSDGGEYGTHTNGNLREEEEEVDEGEVYHRQDGRHNGHMSPEDYEEQYLHKTTSSEVIRYHQDMNGDIEGVHSSEARLHNNYRSGQQDLANEPEVAAVE